MKKNLARKKLGQVFFRRRKNHFLGKMAYLLSLLGREFKILEIGGGKGALTERIRDLNYRVIEKDPDCYQYLLQRGYNVFLGDFLKTSYDQDWSVITGSLPYNVTGQIINHCFNMVNFRYGLFVVQKEFMEKITIIGRKF
jgi:16S rRNA A1518/A1519 N6-dimethyltransferase RsmA/KsgA/DIM1 with predicted DNA glycosylase/AP lyase activity